MTKYGTSVCFSIVSLHRCYFRKNFAVCELILIKLLVVTISRTSWHFSLVDARSRSQLHMAEHLSSLVIH